MSPGSFDWYCGDSGLSLCIHHQCFCCGGSTVLAGLQLQTCSGPAPAWAQIPCHDQAAFSSCRCGPGPMRGWVCGLKALLSSFLLEAPTVVTTPSPVSASCPPALKAVVPRLRCLLLPAPAAGPQAKSLRPEECASATLFFQGWAHRTRGCYALPSALSGIFSALCTDV